jgi:peptidoglycan/LPS O-acetylase OafA/YrhL
MGQRPVGRNRTITMLSGFRIHAPKTDAWLPEIDGLRALAALSVIFHHANGALVDRVLPLANLAVTAFFCLSGFLLFYLFEKELAERQRISVHGYFRRRVLRIWPLYLAIVAIGVVISATAGRLGDEYPRFLQLITFSSNFWMAAFQPWPPNILPPLWSIGVEEHLYILAPLVFFLHRRVGWALAFGAPILIATLWRVYDVATLPADKAGYGGIYFATYAFVDIFLGGAIAAFGYNRRDILSSRRWFRMLTAPRAMWLYAALLLGAGALWNISIFPPYPWYAALMYTLLGILLPLALLNILVNVEGWPARLLRFEPLRVLGILSYSLYAVHFAALQLLQPLARQASGLLGTSGYVAAVFATALAMSVVLHACVERPFLRLKDRSRSSGLPAQSAWTILAVGLVASGIAGYAWWALLAAR